MQTPSERTLWRSVLAGLLILVMVLPAWSQQEDNALEALESRVEQLESTVEWLRLIQRELRDNQPLAWAELRCAEEGYEVISAQGGTFRFLVRCSDASKFLEGHKIKVRVGNPYYAEFDNVVIVVRYGGDVMESHEDGRLLRIPLSDHLKAGEWNEVSVVINPSTPKDLRYLTVALEVGGAILRTRPD